MNKWKTVYELIEKLKVRTFEPNLFDDKLKCICYAPNIGYRSWIFRYKGILVALFDLGNDNYSFQSLVSIMDLIMAELCNLFPRLIRV